MIELVRVDDRLLHGQVAFLWTKHLKIQTILIANDEILSDEFTMLSLNLAKPTGIKLIVDSTANAVESMKDYLESDERVLVVVNNMEDAEYLLKSVKEVRRLNLGGLRERPGSIRITNAITLTNEDIQHCRNLMNDGVNIEMQSVPDMKKRLLTSKDIGG